MRKCHSFCQRRAGVEAAFVVVDRGEAPGEVLSERRAPRPGLKKVPPITASKTWELRER
jgi:hypothetical protein